MPQEDRLKVFLVYGLAAALVVATTALGALGRLSAEQVLSLFRDVLLSLGWWHAQAPRSSLPGGPPSGTVVPAPAVPLWLVVLLPLLFACHGGELTVYGPEGPRA